MTAKWGNPETTSFERQNLRWARFDGTTVQVHKHIWPMVERILIGLDAAQIDVSVAATDMDDPLRRGFRLPAQMESDVETVQAMIGDAMFRYDGSVVSFTGSAEDATKIVLTIGGDVETDEEEPDVIPPEEPRAPVAPPYGRTMDDPAVERFWRVLVGVGYDATAEEFESELRTWQRRHGVEPHGELDDSTWSNVLPQRAKWLRPGATGEQVKVLQAAFKERGYYTGKITGVWGVEMSRSLRRFQHDYRIFPRLRIGNPEWAALFG